VQQRLAYFNDIPTIIKGTRGGEISKTFSRAGRSDKIDQRDLSEYQFRISTHKQLVMNPSSNSSAWPHFEFSHILCVLKHCGVRDVISLLQTAREFKDIICHKDSYTIILQAHVSTAIQCPDRADIMSAHQLLQMICAYESVPEVIRRLLAMRSNEGTVDRNTDGVDWGRWDLSRDIQEDLWYDWSDTPDHILVRLSRCWSVADCASVLFHLENDVPRDPYYGSLSDLFFDPAVSTEDQRNCLSNFTNKIDRITNRHGWGDKEEVLLFKKFTDCCLRNYEPCKT
jgi:hypothetical protein